MDGWMDGWMDGLANPTSKRERPVLYRQQQHIGNFALKGKKTFLLFLEKKIGGKASRERERGEREIERERKRKRKRERERESQSQSQSQFISELKIPARGPIRNNELHESGELLQCAASAVTCITISLRRVQKTGHRIHELLLKSQ